MKAPSIFSCLYNLPGHCLLQSNPARLGFSDLPPAPPAEEIIPTEDTHAKLFATEPVSLPGGIILLKGRITNSDVAGIPSADLVPGTYEGKLLLSDSYDQVGIADDFSLLSSPGGLKLSECATDLVDTLRREIQDGQLSFRGKRVLELGCGHGLPGVFACIKGASTVHFQDFNIEVVKRLTIPNVSANLDYARARISRHNGSLTPTRSMAVSPDLRYFSGDWADVQNLLSQASPPDLDNDTNVDFGFSFDYSSRPSTPLGEHSRPSTPSTPVGDREPSRPSTPTENGGRSRRRSNGSRAFESSRECSGYQEDGYDIILMSDTIYSSSSLSKLYTLLKKCLRPYYGVVYVAAKKHYFGRGGGSRQFKNMVEDDGILGAHLVAEFPDGYSSTREVWKFFFR
ncbi:histidine protein methyltransferase 1 homolog isoform X1 [Selaginella moellendorffii]|uniref:histidine protein methyltransferase 1 homolog isoform X1 n=1 Tax=Selaginella moellendorffii TaxID=88036 RepID=UPI000D1C78D3|nr:histidine protein methyltransferase 1 homolog isoform X1 [Selaginella moellendorffii]|eukprot:XP_024517666.1 histidine protein methyltransferase 1 homolog isoform X1 [Selaginella moellendorffii]